MPNYMEIPNEELAKLVGDVIPCTNDLGFGVDGPDSIQFVWRDSHFRVYHSLVVREIVDGVSKDTNASLLMEAMLDLAKEKADNVKSQSADERYWSIECSILETERIKAEAQLTLAKVGLIEVEANKELAEAERMVAEKELIEARENTTAQGTKVTCACGSELVVCGVNDAEEIRIMINNFDDNHSRCR